MSGAEKIKRLIPGIITRMAITYPFVYIDSVSFSVKDKLIAACFWNHKKADLTSEHFVQIGSDIFPGCYFYQQMDELKTSEIEVTGRDEQGRNMLVTMPLGHINSMY